MGEKGHSIDAKIVKKTQDTLGKIVKRPALAEKLLNKPPFRFLHDIMTSVVKTTGFMKGLFTEGEMNSENVKDKDSKVAFLQKVIDMVSLVLGKTIAAKPSKIVAGQEAERTNELLQALADAINKKVKNDEYVQRVLKTGGDTKSDTVKKEKDPEKRKKDKEDDGKKPRGDRDKSRDRGDKHKEREKSHDRDREKSRDKDKDKPKDREHKDRDRSKDKDREKSRDRREKDKPRDKDEADKKDKDRERRKRREEREDKPEPDHSTQNGEAEAQQEEPPPRIPRPTSAKGSRRRHGHADASSDEEEEHVRQREQEQSRHREAVGEDDLPPQVAAARKLQRPSSARPGPPRVKKNEGVDEPVMMGSSNVPNLIVDKDSDSDDDDQFIAKEDDEPETTTMAPPPTQDAEDDGQHGGLVKKILEKKKELEGGSQQPGKKTEIERSQVPDATKRKEREMIQKEIDKLRGSIQTLTRSVNPLGKIMDFLQEDLDSMQKELVIWQDENKENAVALQREQSITESSIEPLKSHLLELDAAVVDQLDLIAAVKHNILKNDDKIEKMLNTVTKS